MGFTNVKVLYIANNFGTDGRQGLSHRQRRLEPQDTKNRLVTILGSIIVAIGLFFIVRQLCPCS